MYKKIKIENENLNYNENLNTLFYSVFRNIYLKSKIIHYLRLYNLHFNQYYFKDINQLRLYKYKEYLRSVYIDFESIKYKKNGKNGKNEQPIDPNDEWFYQILKELPEDELKELKFKQLKLINSINLSNFKNLNLLSIDYGFNQILIKDSLPPNLIYLDLGIDFSQTIALNSLPNSIQTLRLNYDYDFQIPFNCLPTSLINLKLEIGNSNCIEKQIENNEPIIDTLIQDISNFKQLKSVHIIIKHSSKLQKSMLPSNTTILEFYSVNEIDFQILPTSIIDLKIQNQHIESRGNVCNFKPNSIKTITFGVNQRTHSNDIISFIKSCNQLESIDIWIPNWSNPPLSLKNLKVDSFNTTITNSLPSTLESFCFQGFNKTPFPRGLFSLESLTELDIGTTHISFNYHKLINLKSLACDMNLDFTLLPSSVSKLSLYKGTNQTIINNDSVVLDLPSTVENLEFRGRNHYSTIIKRSFFSKRTSFKSLRFAEKQPIPTNPIWLPKTCNEIILPNKSILKPHSFYAATHIKKFVLSNETQLLDKPLSIHNGMLPPSIEILVINNHQNSIINSISDLPSSLKRIIVKSSNFNFLNNINLIEFSSLLVVLK